MKFSCGRCGKKYATAETPAPGRVYKIKCKGCGHLIVVKAPAADAPPTAAATPPAATPATTQVRPPPTATTPPPTPGAQPGAPRQLDAGAALSATGLSASLEPEPPPPGAAAPEAPYVDLFGEPHPADAPPAASGASPVDDPFAAAARASLPDDYGKSSPAPDPFASLKTPPPEPLAATPSAASKVPVIAKPAQHRSSGPIILIALGALVLIGILAFVLLGGQKAVPQTPPQAPVAAPAPAPQPAPVTEAPPPPAPAPEAQPPPAPPARPEAAPAEPPSPEKRTAADEPRGRAARTDRDAAREKGARETKARAERDAAERESAAREARARAERDERERLERARQQQEVASAGEPLPDGLGQDQVQKVLSSSRKAFESCIVNAGKAGAVTLDGRRVMLRLNIQPSGAVTYPTLDDVTLNATDLGGCLKSAARIMVFPRFRGDPMHVEVPLVLSPGR